MQNYEEMIKEVCDEQNVEFFKVDEPTFIRDGVSCNVIAKALKGEDHTTETAREEFSNEIKSMNITKFGFYKIEEVACLTFDMRPVTALKIKYWTDKQ